MTFCMFEGNNRHQNRLIGNTKHDLKNEKVRTRTSIVNNTKGDTSKKYFFARLKNICDKCTMMTPKISSNNNNRRQKKKEKCLSTTKIKILLMILFCYVVIYSTWISTTHSHHLPSRIDRMSELKENFQYNYKNNTFKQNQNEKIGSSSITNTTSTQKK